MWFRAFLVVGALLGVTLLVQSIRNYNFVSNSLIQEELLERADREQFIIGNYVSRADAATPSELGPVLEELVAESENVAWVRILSPQGEVIAAGGTPIGDPIWAPGDEEDPRQLGERSQPEQPVQPDQQNQSGQPNQPGQPAQRNFELRGSGAQRALVTVSPLRFRGPGGGRSFGGRGGFPGRNPRQGQTETTSPPGTTPPDAAIPEAAPPDTSPSEAETPRQASPFERFQQQRDQAASTTWLRGAMSEVALYWDSADSEFIGDLRRNLIIQVSAAIALLGAMAFLGLRFPSYVHGRQLEEQLALARSVQQTLLPSSSPDCGKLDVAARCDPAWQVGGDFYDVFAADNDRVAMLLGDVSGKGLPASLLMGLAHGAVRSSSWAGGRHEHEEATRKLNELLCMRTEVSRFASLFWCYYDPIDAQIRYVNAGHLPPFVVFNGDGNREPRLERLEEGGPVLGVIPDAEYRQGSVEFRAGDMLVLYSDGVVEAANAEDEEFGEQRLEHLILANRKRPASEIRDEILRQVRAFVGSEQFQDDLTLLVVRAGSEVTGLGSLERGDEVPELVRSA